MTIVNRFKKIDCTSLKKLSFAPALVVAYCAGAMEVHSAEWPGIRGFGGVASRGHGKREGPAGDKLSRSDDAGNGGRVRSER